MSDLISRKALHRDIYIRVSQMLQDITDAPAIEAEPVRHGRWENYPGPIYRRCSLCKVEWEKSRFNIRANYCPHCGAKMDGGAEE